jgi:hypothetical protein
MVIFLFYNGRKRVKQKNLSLLGGLLLLLILLCGLTNAQTPPDSTTPPMPATELKGIDTPNDRGGSITLTWQKSADDGAGLNNVKEYLIYRSLQIDGEYTQIGQASSGSQEFTDGNTKDKINVYYKIKTVNKNGLFSFSEPSPPAISKAQWFNLGRINTLVAAIILGGLIFYFISQAKAGKELFIRKIAGLDAVDEAVGRATEMGKKILYIPGTSDMDNVQTIAGVTILARVARLTAEYETPLEVPVSRSLVMVTCREVVKEAYSSAGRPDSYKDDMVHYLTDDQFGYAAGVDGLILREKPATIFYQGAFYAEALIMAETGNSIEAIQIAGTAQPAQIPFFFASCDYTLIGEELFAASAYLSKEPKLLGSLKGQDMGKAIILICLLLGVVFVTFRFYLDFRDFFLVQ